MKNPYGEIYNTNLDKPTDTYMQILNRAIFAKKEKGYEGNLKNIRTFIWIWLQHISCKYTREKYHLTVTPVEYLLIR
jgi:hypothetical protein